MHLADDIRNMSDVVYEKLDIDTKESMIQHFTTALDSPAVQYEIRNKLPQLLDEAARLRESHFGREGPWPTLQPQTKQNTKVYKSATKYKPESEKLDSEQQYTVHSENVQSSQQASGVTKLRPCKLCSGDHMDFICPNRPKFRPCRHCGGNDYDNRCPDNQGKGNFQTVSSSRPQEMVNNGSGRK